MMSKIKIDLSNKSTNKTFPEVTMKYVRFSHNGEVRYGVLKEDKISVLEGDLFGDRKETGEELPLDAVKLLAPCQPSKIMCAGTNYMSHIIECREKMNQDVTVPDHPLIFSKGPNTVADPSQDIIYPTGVNRVDFEGELGVVIGKKCKKATRENAMDYVLGFTCINDVSARDMQWNDGQWTRGKGLDTFCPMGPIITDEIDAFNSRLITRVNGEVLQDGNTNDFIFGIPALIEYITEWITLEAGDVIATGTPAGVAPVKVGDVIEIEIPGIGVLCNKMI